jgi:predicted nucleic acid-binding protein
MEKKYIIDGASILKLLLLKPQSTSTILAQSYILDRCYQEVGELILGRVAIEESEEGQNRIFEIGETLSEILSKMESLDVKWDNFKTLLTIGIYKKLKFYEVVYLWVAKEHKLCLITDDTAILKSGKELEVETFTVESEINL